jgi:hypothetical protein
VQINCGFNPSPCLTCLPQLNPVSVGANIVLAWPTNFPGFNLEISTNLAPPTIWKTNTTTPALINGQNVVTNPVSGRQQFYRLKQ